jgi:hypothetical protein
MNGIDAKALDETTAKTFEALRTALTTHSGKRTGPRRRTTGEYR